MENNNNYQKNILSKSIIIQKRRFSCHLNSCNTNDNEISSKTKLTKGCSVVDMIDYIDTEYKSYFGVCNHQNKSTIPLKRDISITDINLINNHMNEPSENRVKKLNSKLLFNYKKSFIERKLSIKKEILKSNFNLDLNKADIKSYKLNDVDIDVNNNNDDFNDRLSKFFDHLDQIDSDSKEMDNESLSDEMPILNDKNDEDVNDKIRSTSKVSNNVCTPKNINLCKYKVDLHEKKSFKKCLKSENHRSKSYYDDHLVFIDLTDSDGFENIIITEQRTEKIIPEIIYVNNEIRTSENCHLQNGKDKCHKSYKIKNSDLEHKNLNNGIYEECSNTSKEILLNTFDLANLNATDVNILDESIIKNVETKAFKEKHSFCKTTKKKPLHKRLLKTIEKKLFSSSSSRRNFFKLYNKKCYDTNFDLDISKPINYYEDWSYIENTPANPFIETVGYLSSISEKLENITYSSRQSELSTTLSDMELEIQKKSCSSDVKEETITKSTIDKKSIKLENSQNKIPSSHYENTGLTSISSEITNNSKNNALKLHLSTSMKLKQADQNELKSETLNKINKFEISSDENDSEINEFNFDNNLFIEKSNKSSNDNASLKSLDLNIKDGFLCGLNHLNPSEDLSLENQLDDNSSSNCSDEIKYSSINSVSNISLSTSSNESDDIRDYINSSNFKVASYDINFTDNTLINSKYAKVIVNENNKRSKQPEKSRKVYSLGCCSIEKHRLRCDDNRKILLPDNDDSSKPPIQSSVKPIERNSLAISQKSTDDAHTMPNDNDMYLYFSQPKETIDNSQGLPGSTSDQHVVVELITDNSKNKEADPMNCECNEDVCKCPKIAEDKPQRTEQIISDPQMATAIRPVETHEPKTLVLAYDRDFDSKKSESLNFSKSEKSRSKDGSIQNKYKASHSDSVKLNQSDKILSNEKVLDVDINSETVKFPIHEEQVIVDNEESEISVQNSKSTPKLNSSEKRDNNIYEVQTSELKIKNSKEISQKTSSKDLIGKSHSSNDGFQLGSQKNSVKKDFENESVLTGKGKTLIEDMNERLIRENKFDFKKNSVDDYDGKKSNSKNSKISSENMRRGSSDRKKSNSRENEIEPEQNEIEPEQKRSGSLGGIKSNSREDNMGPKDIRSGSYDRKKSNSRENEMEPEQKRSGSLGGIKSNSRDEDIEPKDIRDGSYDRKKDNSRENEMELEQKSSGNLGGIKINSRDEDIEPKDIRGGSSDRKKSNSREDDIGTENIIFGSYDRKKSNSRDNELGPDKSALETYDRKRSNSRDSEKEQRKYKTDSFESKRLNSKEDNLANLMQANSKENKVKNVTESFSSMEHDHTPNKLTVGDADNRNKKSTKDLSISPKYRPGKSSSKKSRHSGKINLEINNKFNFGKFSDSQNRFGEEEETKPKNNLELFWNSVGTPERLKTSNQNLKVNQKKINERITSAICEFIIGHSLDNIIRRTASSQSRFSTVSGSTGSIRKNTLDTTNLNKRNLDNNKKSDSCIPVNDIMRNLYKAGHQISSNNEEIDNFTNYPCEICNRWVPLKKSSEHKIWCTTRQRELQQAALDNKNQCDEQDINVSSMPGTICYLCGHYFTKHSIQIHETCCRNKWIAWNDKLPQCQRRKLPDKPKISGDSIKLKWQHEQSIGNTKYTMRDAINDIMYEESLKNSIC